MQRLVSHLVVALLVFGFFEVSAQRYDFVWLSGYSGGERTAGIDTFGISIMDFNPDTSLHLINDQANEFRFGEASTMICDSLGNLLFYSNGIEIWNYQNQLMENGDSLNVDEGLGWYVLTQGTLALPYPNHDSLWAFIHGTWDIFETTGDVSIAVSNTWYSIIDMNANDGLGKVVQKMDTLTKKPTTAGHITACKHGNGRDWWIVMLEIEDCLFSAEICDTITIKRFLLTPNGIEEYPDFTTEGFILEGGGVGQARFTSDGNQYVFSSSIGSGRPTSISIYDFDRCEGIFSNYRKVELPRLGGFDDASFGMEVSPNSRFVYLVRINRVEQFDLWAEDIKASKIIVAEYDGFRANFSTKFYLPQLAPDGKIYINTPSTTRYLHVINQPNEKGLACDLQQHSVVLPTLNGRSFPNHPNYRLYESVDSPCDTIGKDFTDVSTIASVKIEQSLKIYPNPAFDVLHIALDVPKKASIRLYNVQGQLVLEQSTDQKEQEVDISHLPAGIYFCHIQTNDHQIQTKKIIISR
ncbi:MAG: T9SS type A sorting domain-containing protein [Bacteroidota bacterium]